jgi:phosphoheptose isomerase
MTNEASVYLGELNRLFSAMEIRDQAGKNLSLDEGGKAALDLIRQAKKNKAKAFVVGNGGSAAVASHMQTICARR